MKQVEFWFHVDTLIDVEKVANAYFCEVVSVRSVNACNVFLCQGTETNIAFLDNKFRLLDTRFDDFNEYGGYTKL